MIYSFLREAATVHKRIVVAILLVALSIGLMIYKAETDYQQLAGANRWFRSFGYGFSPWLLGLIVAAIREVWLRIRKQKKDFIGGVLWAAGAFSVLLLASAIYSSAKAQDRQSVRDDAMLLMGVGTWVPGIAAYCNKYVEPNEDLLSAAAAWNSRHKAELNKVVRTLEWTGGLSRDEKALLDKMSIAMLRREIDGQKDKAEYCRNIQKAMNQGMFDLWTFEQTASAIERIMSLELQ
jgi:hypothetical protein